MWLCFLIFRMIKFVFPFTAVLWSYRHLQCPFSCELVWLNWLGKNMFLLWAIPFFDGWIIRQAMQGCPWSGGAAKQRHPCVAIAADPDLGTVAVGIMAKAWSPKSGYFAIKRGIEVPKSGCLMFVSWSNETIVQILPDQMTGHWQNWTWFTIHVQSSGHFDAQPISCPFVDSHHVHSSLGEIRCQDVACSISCTKCFRAFWQTKPCQYGKVWLPPRVHVSVHKFD